MRLCIAGIPEAEQLQNAKNQWKNEIKKLFVKDNKQDPEGKDNNFIYESKYHGIVISIFGEYENLSSLAQFTFIDTIEIQNNIIENLDFMNGSHFRELSIYKENKISNIDGLRNTSLEEIFIEDASNIVDITPLLNKPYWRITLFNLRLKDFLIFSPINTKFLSLRHASGLKDITPFARNRYIEGLDLSFSSISDISALTENIHITHLNLSHTKISDINSLKGHPSISSLDISHTSVYNLYALRNNGNIEFLDISYAPIVDFNILSTLKNLKSLTIDESQIQYIPANVDRKIIKINR